MKSSVRAFVPALLVFTALFGARALGTPATPAAVWRTSQSQPYADTSSPYGVASTARFLTDGSFLMASLSTTGLSLTRVSEAGAVLSTFSVPLTLGNGSGNALLADATGEVYVATDLSAGNSLSKWDAFTGLSLWPAALNVDEIDSPRIALDPAGDVVVVGASRWGSGIVFTKLNRFSGTIEMGPILVGLEYGSFCGIAVDSAGDLVLAGSTQVYNGGGYTYTPMIGKFSGQTGLEIWGPTALEGFSYYSYPSVQLQLTGSGDVCALSYGGYLARLSGATGAVVSQVDVGSNSVLVDLDGAGDAYLTRVTSSTITAKRVSATGTIAWSVVSGYYSTGGAAVDGAGNLALFVDTYSGKSEMLIDHDSGQYQWGPKTYTLSLSPSTVCMHPSGDLFAVGYSSSALGAARFSHADGNVLWSVLGPSSLFSSDTWKAVSVDASGDVLLGGTSGSYYQTKVVLQKQSGQTGQTIWGPIAVGTTSYSPQNLLFAADASGNVVAASMNGSTWSLYEVSGSDGTTKWGPYALSSGTIVELAFDATGDLFILRDTTDSSSVHRFSLTKVSGGTNAWSVTWSSTAHVNDVPTDMCIDAAGNAIVAGTSRVAANGGTRAVLLSFSGATGAVLWGPLEYDDFGQGVGRVLVTRTGSGSLYLSTFLGASNWTGYPVWIRMLDATGTSTWGPVSPTLPSPGYYYYDQRWLQVADPSGDLVVCLQQSSYNNATVAKIRGASGAVAWTATLPLSYASPMQLLLDADGNIAIAVSSSSYSPSSSSGLYRFSGVDGSALWTPLLSSSPIGIPMLQAAAILGRDVVLAGASGGGAAVATRIGGNLGVVAPTVALVASCGQPYSLDLVAVNGRQPYTWSVVSGALPQGLTLSSGGQIGGSASGQGTFSFRVQVSDADGKTATSDLRMSVVDGSPMIPVVVTPPNPCQGDSVTLSVAGTWSTYEWLPGGQGTSTVDVVVNQPATFGVTVVDASGCARHGAVTLEPRPRTKVPVITAPATATANTAGLVASVAAHAGSTFTWSVSSGSITAGQGTNQITFTTGAAGTLTITVRETASGACASAAATASVQVPVPGAFYAITPCRVLDTRTPSGGPSIAAAETRVVTVAGTCGIPGGAKAITANVTTVLPLATGDLRLGPGDLPASSLGTVPLVLGRVRAVSAILGLATNGSGTVAFGNESGAGVDVLLDVSGYFY